MVRQCKKCNLKKDISFFVKKRNGKGDYYLYSCKECNKKYTKQYCASYYKSNRSKLINASKNWYRNNLDKKKEYDKKYILDTKYSKKIYDKIYRIKNKIKINQRTFTYIKNRRINDPIFRLRKNISYSIWYHLKLNDSSKKESIIKYLNYSIKDLKKHLESKFESWMNWSNYGTYSSSWDDNNPLTWRWNIDHIIPQSKLPYFSMEDDNFKKCWSLNNLRPFSAKQNIIDGNKR